MQVKRDAIDIDKVIVNGRVLFKNGKLTGALLGQISLFSAGQREPGRREGWN